MARGPVVVRRYEVPFPQLPAAFRGFRIAHVSDLHLRRWNRVCEHTRTLLQTLEYDLLAITGDFCVVPEQWPKAADLLAKLLEGVDPPHGVMSALGNHDAPQLADQAHLPTIFLRDEVRSVSRSGVILPIAGVDQTLIDDNGLRRALAGIAPRRHAVLLAHYPSTVYRLPPGRVGLTLSGHTHGGQIRIPGLGCLWTNDHLSRDKGSGLHVVNRCALHVSAGIGVSGPILARFHCPPEIGLLTLVPMAGEESVFDVRPWELPDTEGKKFRKAV